jgi:hypothetical protein
MNIIFALLVSVVWTAFQSSYVQNDPALKNLLFFRITMQPVLWILNFFTFLGLLALFYYQGIKARTEKE